MPTRGDKERAESALTTLAENVAGLQESIATLITAQRENTETVKDLTEETTKRDNELSAKLDDYFNQGKDLKLELVAARSHVENLEHEVEFLKKREEDRERNKSKLNVIIKGVPEVPNEKMYESMRDFLSALGATFVFSATNGAYRIGKLSGSSGNDGQHGRNIKLMLATIQQKSEIFGLRNNLLQEKRFEHARINNELNNDELMVYRELQQLHMAAKHKGVASKIKGSKLIIDNQVYERQNFDNLPYDLTLESSSTMETPDGTAFQGHTSPLSNFYPIRLEDSQGRKAQSAEQLYAMHMAEECRCSAAVQKQVTREMNPYELKNLTRQIQKTASWKERSTQVLAEVVELKFTSHPSLMAKLQGCKKEHFYEATRDPVFGCGFLLSQAKDITIDKVKPHSNVMGKILSDIRNKYKPQASC